MGKDNWEQEIAQSKFIDKTAFDLTRKTGSFSLAELVAACGNSGFGRNSRKILHDLTFRSNVTALPRKNGPHFIHHKALFGHAEFLVKLTEFELKHKVFIVGHRLMPFIKENRIRMNGLQEKGTNETLPTKDVKIPLRELTKYYWLYDEDNGMFSDLAGFKGATSWLDHDLPEIGTVSCYDLSSFMAKTQFTTGDYLKLRPKDELFAKCEIEYFPASAVASNPAKIMEWKNKFESGLTQAINYRKQRGGEFENGDLITAAFYYGGKSLLTNPLASWFEVLRDSGKFSLQYVGGRLFIWDKSLLRDHMHNELERDEAVEFGDLKYMRFPELTALMGLRMYGGNTLGEMLHFICSGGTLRDARKYCYDERFAKCAPELRERFNKMIAGIWRRARSWKDSETCLPEAMRCRKNMMELKDRILEFISKLEKQNFDPEKLYSEDFVMLERLLVAVYGYFFDFHVFPGKLKRTVKIVPKISSRLETTISRLEKEFMSKPTTR